MDPSVNSVSQAQLFSSILECSICLSLLCEPISLSCGHTYCRVCLVKSLRRHKKQCPGCREVCHVVAEDAHENITIKSLAIALDPELYKQRVAEVAVEKESFTSVYPIFFYNQTLLPGSKLNLHLFEPRYKLMMSRVVNSSRAFAYVASNRLSPGGIALIAEVKEAEFMADGRCIIEANLCRRGRIVEHYLEDGTQGLHHCRLEALRDEVVTPEHMEALNALKMDAHTLVAELLSNNTARQMVDAQFGTAPSDTEAFSMWLAAVSPLSEHDKTAVLHSRSTIDRFTLCNQRLELYLEQKRNPGAFPLVSAFGQSIASTLSALLNGGREVDDIDNNSDGWHGVEEGGRSRTGAGSEANRSSRADDDTADQSDSDDVPSLISDSTSESDQNSHPDDGESGDDLLRAPLYGNSVFGNADLSSEDSQSEITSSSHYS